MPIQQWIDKMGEHACALAVLIDPDKISLEDLPEFVQYAEKQGANFFFVGGSLLTTHAFSRCVSLLKKHAAVPVLIFPGSAYQVHPEADALLLLSLISGRNADLLIGQHVMAAPMIKSSGLKTIATGYMLVDGGAPTTASYISNTSPIPHNKADIAAVTALAGEMLGLKCIYLDAGSGAKQAVSAEMIRAVKQTVKLPLLVGGGIRNAEQARNAAQAGANVIVVGNVLESDLTLLTDLIKGLRG
jgi:phosphoglycerol geranylgeranyltransferase